MKFILTGLGNWAPAWKLVEAGVKEAEKQRFRGVVFPDKYMWDPKTSESTPPKESTTL